MNDDKPAGFSDQDLISVRANLLLWWHENGRSFPWRETNNPFHILISEILLQRTRAEQVVAVYNAFIARYSSPDQIAADNLETIKSTIYSLGLPQRADTLFNMAHQLTDLYDNKVPDTYKQLRTLSGVGDYIACAVCCFAFNQSVSVIDTNTVRIIGRMSGIKTDAESRRKRVIRDLHNLLLDHENPREYNYAMLDLGAVICTSLAPRCSDCPIKDHCVYPRQTA